MGRPAAERRSTALSGVLLALLLVGGAVVARVAAPADGPTVTSPPVTSPPASRTPVARVVPRPGPAYPVRRVGALGERTRIVSGEGNAELRYARAPGQPTRLHFICTGCDADTWLVEWPRGQAVGDGPLPDPADATAALDVSRPGATTRLLVRAPAGAGWMVTLTPFDVVPVHREGFDGLGHDVVAVRARGAVALSCPDGPVDARAESLARPAGREEYALVDAVRPGGGGTYALRVPAGADLLVLVVACTGRWSVTLP